MVTFPQLVAMVTYTQLVAMVTYTQLVAMVTYPQLVAMVTYPQLVAMVTYPQLVAMVTLISTYNSDIPCKVSLRQSHIILCIVISRLVQPSVYVIITRLINKQISDILALSVLDYYKGPLMLLLHEAINSHAISVSTEGLRS